MQTLPEESPTTQDLHGDVNVRSSGLPDERYEQPADAFPEDEPMTDAELERLCAAEAVKPKRVTVRELTSAGHMGFLTVQDGTREIYILAEIASVFGNVSVGDTGTIWQDSTGAWNFDRDRTAAHDAQDAYIAECDAYEAARPKHAPELRCPIHNCGYDREGKCYGCEQLAEQAARLEVRPISNRCVRPDPAAWGVKAG